MNFKLNEKDKQNVISISKDKPVRDKSGWKTSKLFVYKQANPSNLLKSNEKKGKLLLERMRWLVTVDAVARGHVRFKSAAASGHCCHLEPGDVRDPR